MSIRVGINGFGRIGRLVMRAAQSNPNISIVGVNDPFIPVDYMRYMLKYDTVHGRFPNTVEVAGDSIAVGGDKVKVFGERDPSGAVWKSTSELGYSSGHGDDVASMAWGARNLISTQVLHVSELQPPVADWRGSGRLPAAMRGQPHHLSVREAVLPLRAVDRRNPQQRRHPALKSGSLSRSSLIAPPPPRRPDCVHNTYVSFLRARRIDRGGPG